MSDFKNLIIAVVATMAILFGWQYFYELPRMKEYEKQAQIRKQIQPKNKVVAVKEISPFLEIKDAVSNAGRVVIKGNKITGSMSLVGARIDDLTLNDYLVSAGSDEQVRLCSPLKQKMHILLNLGGLEIMSSSQIPTLCGVQIKKYYLQKVQ